MDTVWDICRFIGRNVRWICGCVKDLAVRFYNWLCCQPEVLAVRFYNWLFDLPVRFYNWLCCQPEEWLIKRCEQDNLGLRDVENQIIGKTKLHEIPWSQDVDDGQTPVLVFCVNASRIGTDIESALKGVQIRRPVLVVLHCINNSSLRGDLTDDDYLLDQALRDRVTGIAHFAFSDFEGFYSCRQNEDGLRRLKEFKDEKPKKFEITKKSQKSEIQTTTGTKEWLIKRCKQDNPGLRDVENQIIRKTIVIQNESWTQDLDDGQTPVLVFCVNASRIGTDIESALKGVQSRRPVLVVLHCINMASLRGDLSDDDYLLDQALRNQVVGIAHFAFSDFDGLYPCRQNEDGFRMLSAHITKVRMSLDHISVP